MKRIILFLAIIASAFSFSATAQNIGVSKDTCRCFYPPKKDKSNRQSSQGIITQSFNDNITIEDHTGSAVDLSSYALPDRFVPQVSNLKQVSGSFNRYLTIRKYPAPAAPKTDSIPYTERWWYADDYGWLAVLLFIAVVILLAVALSRGSTSSVSHTHTHTHKHEFASPPAKSTDDKSKPVAPAIDLDKAGVFAKEAGATVIVNADASVVFKFPKPEKTAEEKKSDQQ